MKDKDMTKGRVMAEEEPYDEHKHTPAILPIIIGMTIMLLLVIVYCIYAWVKHSKEKRANRFSHRSQKSNASRGRHQRLPEDA